MQRNGEIGLEDRRLLTRIMEKCFKFGTGCTTSLRVVQVFCYSVLMNIHENGWTSSAIVVCQSQDFFYAMPVDFPGEGSRCFKAAPVEVISESSCWSAWVPGCFDIQKLRNHPRLVQPLAKGLAQLGSSARLFRLDMPIRASSFHYVLFPSRTTGIMMVPLHQRILVTIACRGGSPASSPVAGWRAVTMYESVNSYRPCMSFIVYLYYPFEDVLFKRIIGQLVDG